MGEPTDSAEVAAGLNRALPLQARDAIAAAIAAGTLTGVEGIALQEPLRLMAAAETADLERLAGRILTLGAGPAVDVPEVSLPKTLKPALRALQGLSLIHI